MLVQDLVSKFGLQAKALSKEGGLRTVEGGYSGDVLSHVMAGAKPGYVWLTVQTHENIVAVASLLDVACILVCQRELPEETCERARREGVAVLWTERGDFEMSGLLYQSLCGNQQCECSTS
ncbi:MAG: hypothetical protein ACOYEQ_09570 [Bacillota bacterium]|jgi:hypothetical protein